MTQDTNPAGVAADILDCVLEDIAENRPVAEWPDAPTEDEYQRIIQAEVAWERQCLIELVRRIDPDIIGLALAAGSVR